MRITNKLYAQHIGWHFKKHWQIQGRRVPRDTGAAAELLKFGIHVKDPEEILNPKVERKVLDIVGSLPKPVPRDQTHPNWHQTPIHQLGDGNILLGGLQQAQVLTNTIEINSYPPQIEQALLNQQLPSAIDRKVQNAILASNVLDAEQVKLPKIKLADRPGYNLPRVYGISHERRNRLLMNKLLFEIEKLAGRSLCSRRKHIDNATFKTNLTKDNDQLEFSTKAEKLVISGRALDAIKGKYTGELPHIFPMKSTISIPKIHIFTTDNYYPLRTDLNCSHPHTIISYFNKEIVGNLHRSEVTETQFQSRTMLKAFTVAAARAKQIHGNEINANVLSKPIVVQSIHTDGRSFHLGVFQLNTLNLESNEGVRNYWFHRPSIDLYVDCGYKTGKPYLEGYNSELFRILNAFYHSS